MLNFNGGLFERVIFFRIKIVAKILTQFPDF
jgi:hypothetical protein